MMNHVEKEIVLELYDMLANGDNQSGHMLDILDVLLAVYKKLDKAKHPERLINRLNQYIRITASTGKINFSSEAEQLIIELGTIGQKAGINGSYMADFFDKSQFYQFGERVPYHYS